MSLQTKNNSELIVPLLILSQQLQSEKVGHRRSALKTREHDE